MSLYHHVQDKDDLLDEVTDGLLSDVWKPHGSRSNWHKWTAEAADRLRLLLVSEPVALHVYLRHPVVSPAAIARMDAMLQVLRAAGYGEMEARRRVRRTSTRTRSASPPSRPRVAKLPGSRRTRTKLGRGAGETHHPYASSRWGSGCS